MVTIRDTAPNRETEEVSFSETFGIKPPSGKDQKVLAFKEPGPLTPKLNPYYRFPQEETMVFLLSLQMGDTTYILGHSGTGKTDLVQQIAARLNYNLMVINMDGHLTRADLVGEPVLKAGEVGFRYGMVPRAFELPGTITLFDEVDSMVPETAFVLQRAVSEDRTFLLMETNEIFPLHPQNRLVGTANTAGLGDDTGLYTAGTHIQNFSFMTRWQTTIKLDYLSRKEEQEMLQKRFPKISKKVLTSVTGVLHDARTSYRNGDITFPLTTRDAINWVHKINRMVLPMKSAKYAFLHKMPLHDASVIAKAIAHWFEISPRDDQGYNG